MAAVNSTSGTNRLRTDSLSGGTGNDVLLLSVWVKPETSFSYGSSNYVGDWSVTATARRIGLFWNASRQISGSYDAGSNWGATEAVPEDAWTNLIISWGPWDGTSRTRRGWFNGANRDTAAATATSSTATFERLSLFSNKDGTGILRGKIARVGVWVNPSNITQLVADLQTYIPEILSPLYAWSCAADGNSTVGSANLTTTGTISFDGDMPSLLTELPSSGRRRTVMVL